VAANADVAAQRGSSSDGGEFKFTPGVNRAQGGRARGARVDYSDRKHGFQVPDLKIDEVIEPGKITRVRIVPDKAATYDFHCTVFCGSGTRRWLANRRSP